MPQEMRRWDCFLFSPGSARKKEGGILAAPTGEDPSFLACSPRRLLTTRQSWPCRGAGAFWLRRGFWPSARSCGRVRRRDRENLYGSPRRTAPPEVLLQRAPARGRRGRTRQRVFGDPPALQAYFDCARGYMAPGDVWYPRRKTATSAG